MRVYWGGIDSFRLSRPKCEHYVVNLGWVDLNEDNYVNQFMLSRPKWGHYIVHLGWVDLNEDIMLSI
jgi:hypothetical protein